MLYLSVEKKDPSICALVKHVNRNVGYTLDAKSIMNNSVTHCIVSQEREKKILHVREEKVTLRRGKEIK